MTRDRAVDLFTLHLAERVRTLRDGAGWSQEELAEYADCHRNEIGFVERGDVAPKWTTVAKLAMAFGLTIAGLFPDDRFEAARSGEPAAAVPRRDHRGPRPD